MPYGYLCGGNLEWSGRILKWLFVIASVAGLDRLLVQKARAFFCCYMAGDCYLGRTATSACSRWPD